MLGLGIALAALAGGALLLSGRGGRSRAEQLATGTRAGYALGGSLDLGTSAEGSGGATPDPSEHEVNVEKYPNGFPASSPDAGKVFTWNRQGEPEEWYIKAVTLQDVEAEKLTGKNVGKVTHKQIDRRRDRWTRPGEEVRIDSEQWQVRSVGKVKYSIVGRGAVAGKRRKMIIEPSPGPKPAVRFKRPSKTWENIPVVNWIGQLVLNVGGVIAGLFSEGGEDDVVTAATAAGQAYAGDYAGAAATLGSSGGEDPESGERAAGIVASFTTDDEDEDEDDA